MIEDPGDTFFPYNIVFVLEAFLGTLDKDITFVRRPIVVTDPDQTIALTPARVLPVESSKEIGRIEATIQEYSVMIQTLIVDMDEQRGLRLHSLFAKLVRELVSRDGALRVALGKLKTEDSMGIEESVLKWNTGDQIFHVNQVGGQFMNLSTLEFKLETQIK